MKYWWDSPKWLSQEKLIELINWLEDYPTNGDLIYIERMHDCLLAVVELNLHRKFDKPSDQKTNQDEQQPQK